MKSILLKVGLLATLSVGLVAGKASAEEMDWATKCLSMGDIKVGENPPYQQINCLLTNAALSKNIPPEVVKGIATQESGWRQFYIPNDAEDPGIGIMQITDSTLTLAQQERLKTDILYNIQTGVNILSSKASLSNLPHISEAGPDVIENWYFPVMAYNGIVQVNSPLIQDSGEINYKAYQELVFRNIEKDSYLDGTSLSRYPFEVENFKYVGKTIEFLKTEYNVQGVHNTTFGLNEGDRVITTEDKVKLRTGPGSPCVEMELPVNTPLIIKGSFEFDETKTSKNQFVWFPVSTVDGHFVGYVSSAYIEKQLDTVLPVDEPAPDSPVVNEVTDSTVKISGTTDPFSTVMVNGKCESLGRDVADEKGNFSIAIEKKLKADTEVRVVATNTSGKFSEASILSVLDRTPPSVPSVNLVTNKASEITGKTEAGATINAVIGSKTFNATADVSGIFKIIIPVQNIGTVISVTSTDTAHNQSKSQKLTVERVAPNIPVVNTVTNKSTTVTGVTEKAATVIVKAGSLSYSDIADSYGKFIVKIPTQNSSVEISITAKDAKGNISLPKKIQVKKVAPNVPVVNLINNKTSMVTGKTEKYAVVTVWIGTKSYTAKADSAGNFKVTIPIQNSNTPINVTATVTGRVSNARSLNVTRVAPNIPVVSPVRYNSTTVSGKTEKYAYVTVKIGKNNYKSKANNNGTFKVSIPKQKAGTYLYVSAKDAKGLISAIRTVKVY
ncbi:Ig-like domain-containing protein [Gottfriedia acidiceleris]|uniref:Ig-like domain-containing protein n=1 Tax=Gottfriedia acidiceleris TaxID=371036 RepID=UPI002FFEE3E9